MAEWLNSTEKESPNVGHLSEKESSDVELNSQIWFKSPDVGPSGRV